MTRTTGRRPPPSVLWAGLLAGVVSLAACSDSGRVSEVSPPTVTAASALPPGAAVADPAEVSEPSTDDCNARASLAPAAEPVTAGNLPAGTALAKIADRGYLRAGVDQSSYLAGYRDPLTGEFSGFEIDLVREIARALFGDGDPERIRFTVLADAQRQLALDQGRVDIVASTMTVTCQRRQPEQYFDDEYVEQFPAVEFSSPYLLADQRVLVRQDSPITGPDDLGGARVCVAAGTTVEQNMAHYELGEPVELVTVEVRSDCLSLLQSRQVDAVTAGETALAGFVAQDPNVKIVGTGLGELPAGFAMSPDDPELTRFVNQVLADLVSSGRWLEIIDAWVGQSGPLADEGLATLQPPVPQYRDAAPTPVDASQ